MTKHQRQRVYFVDDEPSVCKAVGRTLEQLDVSVSCFTRGADCLGQLDRQQCDVLITDVKMPELGGLEVLKRAKIIAPWMPVLMVTGFGDIPTAVKAVKMGAADFVEKPLERESFLRLVQKLLDYSQRWTQLIGQPLTKTETKVLCYVLDGKSSKEIAASMHRSLRTVELHRQHIMRKFGVENVVELVRTVTELGLVLPTATPGASPQTNVPASC